MRFALERPSRLGQLLDDFFRTPCALCVRRARAGRGLRPGAFCSECEPRLPWWRLADGCPRCGTLARTDAAPEGACRGCLADGSALHTAHALLRYEGAIRRYVPAFKNTRDAFGPPAAVERAIRHLSRELAFRRDGELRSQIDVIVSVPLHVKRLAKRGFNQADVVAREIARSWGRPFEPSLLERHLSTAHQAGQRGAARRENVRSAFRVPEAWRATCARNGSLRVGLVDDVLTTGNTLEAAADALLEAGALEVRALTLAATLPPVARTPRRRATRRPSAYALDDSRRDGFLEDRFEFSAIRAELAR